MQVDILSTILYIQLKDKRILHLNLNFFKTLIFLCWVSSRNFMRCNEQSATFHIFLRGKLNCRIKIKCFSLRFELVLQSVCVAIIVVVASNDPRKHEATNENGLHFTASRNFQSGDPETLVAFTPSSSAAKKKREKRVNERKKRMRKWGRGEKRKKEVFQRPSQDI